MSMPALDIREIPVHLHLGAAAAVEARFFLHQHGRKGKEGLLERLNGPEEFLPVRMGDGVRLVARASIAWMETGDPERESETDDEPDLLATPIGLGVNLRTGHRVEGAIQVLLPDNRNRLLDFLNLREAFFPIAMDGRTAVVNKDWIESVEPLSENI